MVEVAYQDEGDLAVGLAGGRRFVDEGDVDRGAGGPLVAEGGGELVAGEFLRAA